MGELLSTAAMARGARGAVVDGLVRDVKKISNSAFLCSPPALNPSIREVVESWWIITFRWSAVALSFAG